MAKKRIATFLGPNLGLSIIGGHAYAYSGGVESSTSEQTILNFTTGTDYIVATLTMTAPIRMAAITQGVHRGYQLNFNGLTVGLYKLQSTDEDMPSDTEAQILIPPFTRVILTCIDSSDDAAYLGTANLTGRVYDV